MLTAKEIKDKAERSYKDFLLSVVKREIFFPFHIKGNKGNANLPMQELFPALRNLIDNSKEKTGSGYTLTYKEVNTRHSGIITLPEDIFFENPQDYLQFIAKEANFLSFRKAVDLTKRQAPTLLPWLESNILKVQKHADIWADILKIVNCHCEERSNLHNYYWQQLPIEVDLAAMEVHQPLITELLNVVLPRQYIKVSETQFEKRFGLRYDEPLLRIRFLDKNEDIARPISAWKELDCKNVFFITDKNVFLSFPQQILSVAILWEIASSSLLAMTASIFNGKNIYFIGDITPKGFEQLSEMRSTSLRGGTTKQPTSIHPFLMNKTTFDAFPQHHENIKISNPNAFLTHLNDEEQAMYQFLISLNEKNGLLQRNVSHAFLLKQLGTL